MSLRLDPKLLNQPAPDPSERTKVKVLVVDEDASAFASIANMLKQAARIDVTTRHAEDYETAFGAMLSNQDDVCLVNYRIGARTGLELLGEAARASTRAPVILMGAAKDSTNDMTAMRMGAADFLDRARLSTDLLERSIRYALERKRTEDRLVYLAQHDHMTGLVNRTLFRERLDRAITRARRGGYRVGLLYLDVDRFKNVNDTLGHHAGDELLLTVSQRITESIRNVDTAARLGGDEFTVILDLLNVENGASIAAARVVHALHQPMVIANEDLRVSGSVGVAVFPDDAQDADGLIRKADAAMYVAKQRGGNNFAFSTESVEPARSKKLTIENSLQRALDERQFFLCYQPQLDLITGTVTGAEALIRWRHPERGIVSPADFIPALEETGLIVPVGEWVLKQACEQNVKWLAEGIGPLRVGVNVSPRQFRQAQLVEVVGQVLDETGLDPALLDLEVTESMLMDGVEANRQLTALEGMGVHLSLDDFGTGYSSLAYLRRFPIDVLKIDRAFVADVLKNEDDAVIAEAIIGLAHNLRINVVAEGVEDGAQLDFLKQAGCDVIQGFLVARPMPADDFATWYLQHRKTHRVTPVAPRPERKRRAA